MSVNQKKRRRDCAVDFDDPTNIASVRLVSACPNARAGVKIVSGIVGKKTFDLATLITSSVVTAGVPLVTPILVGNLYYFSF